MLWRRRKPPPWAGLDRAPLAGPAPAAPSSPGIQAPGDEGAGPLYYVFSEGGHQRVARRGSEDYDLISQAITDLGKRRR